MSLERLEITPFAVIAGDLLQNRRTGYLTVVRGATRVVLYWSQGELVLIAPAAPEQSLADYVARRNVITHEQAARIGTDDPVNAVAHFHETGALGLSARQTLLREWIHSLFIPLFSMDEGSAAFTEDNAIEPEKRVFLQSTAALVVEGVRTITNGLILRRSLGDLKREIEFSRDSRFSLDNLPLTDAERQIANTLSAAMTIEALLKRFPSDSLGAARVVISLMCVGVFTPVDERSHTASALSADDMQRDLELLAAIGASDTRSLRAVALSRQLQSMNHYQILDIPRAASRNQVTLAGDMLKKTYDPTTYPPAARESVELVSRRIDEAVNVLKDPARRLAYDKMVQEAGRGVNDSAMQQRLAQRSIAQQNFARAKALSADSDYYGAIVLLKQAVQFSPDMADAWFLLGSCQERNPKWRREAAESFQMALSVDPNHIEAMISLGDLYRMEGLTTRAQTCYEDALKIAPDNQQAKSRLQALKKR